MSVNTVMHMRLPILLAAAACAMPITTLAQDTSGMDMSGHSGHQQHAPQADPSHDPQPAMPAMDHASTAEPAHAAMQPDGSMDMHMHMEMDMHGSMTGALGAYSMMRDASGTAWQPDSAPMEALMGRKGAWSTMVHGFATLIHDHQGGGRGDDKTFSTSMLMGMAQRKLGDGILTLRGMVSLDPLMGKGGYPLLLATGETADGQTELVDRQHPHDAFMELAATYAHPLTDAVSGFLYVGLPGEPALGPATFMHRVPGMANPEAPISHHWLDSTHITFGVATAGLVYRNLKLEGSVFNGREPDQFRWNIESPRFDSWSVRATWNPIANLSMQASRGHLESPEQLHPEENVRRTTASIAYNLPLGTERNWQSVVAWGRNQPSGGEHARATDAWLLESALQWNRWTVFGRLENVDKDELFGDAHGSDPLAGRVFNVTKASLGGYRTFALGRWAWDFGGLLSSYALPTAIQPVYGSNPYSYMVFARVRIGAASDMGME